MEKPAPGTLLRSVALRYRAPCRPSRPEAPSRKLLLFGGGEKPRPTPTSNAPTARDERLARLEAVLFLAREPLTSRKLAQFAGLADASEARTLIRRLNQLYDDAHTAFRVEEIAGGYQLLTRAMFGPWIRRMRPSAVENRLSSPALETLAVVAYRQPVLRADIEAIRGVQCGEMLRQLMERNLVRIVGKSDELGRPFLYGTTKHFLAAFGLRDLDDLPRSELRRETGGSGAGSQQDNPGAGQDDEMNVLPSNQEELAVAHTITLSTLRDSAQALDDAARSAEWDRSSEENLSPIAALDDDEDEDDYDDEDEDDEDDDELDDEDDLEEDDEWEEVDDDDEDWDDEDDEDWDDEDEDEDDFEDED